MVALSEGSRYDQNDKATRFVPGELIAERLLSASDALRKALPLVEWSTANEVGFSETEWGMYAKVLRIIDLSIPKNAAPEDAFESLQSQLSDLQEPLTPDNQDRFRQLLYDAAVEKRGGPTAEIPPLSPPVDLPPTHEPNT